MLERVLRPRPIPVLLGVPMIAGLTPLGFGRPIIRICGTITLWGRVASDQSQMLADWYSPSHIVHTWQAGWTASN